MNDQIITAIKEEFAYSIPEGYQDRDIHLTDNIVLHIDFDYESISIQMVNDLYRVTPPEPRELIKSPTTNLNASIWIGDNRRDATESERSVILDTLNEIEE